MGQCRVEIMKVNNKETRVHEEETLPNDPEAYEYLWSEGNYACDCNRGLLFDRAATDHGADVKARAHTCGDGQYIVRVTINGVVVYDELDT